MNRYSVQLSKTMSKKIEEITQPMLRTAFPTLILILEREPFYKLSEEIGGPNHRRIISDGMPHKLIVVYVVDTKNKIVKIIDFKEATVF